MSDDGNVVVGDYQVNTPFSHRRAFRWIKNHGFFDLGTLPGLNAHAYGVSGDGKIIVGNAQNNNVNVIGRAFFWTDTSGIVDIGTLGGNAAIAYDISTNGNTIVGKSEDGTFGRLMAFRWEQNYSMVNLGSFCNGCVSNAVAVSSDGSVIVGYAEYATYHNAVRWTSNYGLQDLGRLGGVQSEAYGVSEDGSVVVGRTDVNHPNGIRSHAFKWTLSDGMVDIHNDNVGSGFSTAYSVSADGKRIVGIIQYPGTNISRAFLWTEENGMKILSELFSNLLSYGSELRTANKITPDGRFIIGSGYNSSTGKSSAYILDTGPAVHVKDETNRLFLPVEFELYQNYPNPFNTSTLIKYQLPQTNKVEIKIYNIFGQEVQKLVDEVKDAGYYEVVWNIDNNTGGQVASGVSARGGYASGVYFYKLQSGSFTSVKKMLLVR